MIQPNHPARTIFNGKTFHCYRAEVEGIAIADETEIAYGVLIDDTGGQGRIPFAIKAGRAFYTSHDFLVDVTNGITHAIDRGQRNLFLAYF
jgi:hypothetical protein